MRSMTKAELEFWICSRLCTVLNLKNKEDVEGLARNILCIENTDDEVRKYLENLLDVSENADFIRECVEKISCYQNKANVSNAGVFGHHIIARLDYLSGFGVESKAYKKSHENIEIGGKKSKTKKKGRNKLLDNEVLPEFTKELTTTMNDATTKKRTCFVSLYGKEGKDRTQNIVLPGRNRCQCLAQRHSLVNNCLKCGRIVCSQEGSGPCMFCGALVCTGEEMMILSSNTKQGKKLERELRDKAIEHKNRLLEYDKTCVKRTQVIDDESDWFSSDTNKWLSDDQRATIKSREERMDELRHGSRLNMKIVLDFAGRRVVDQAPLDQFYKDLHQSVVEEGNDETAGLNRYSEGLCDPTLMLERPSFIDCNSGAAPLKTSVPQNVDEKVSLRNQDKELQELRDSGMCLSMHQPWASLLIAGIKREEGRSWYSTHRGRLWIASTAKQVQDGDIADLEAYYEVQNSATELVFPSSYPSGCLLGCVTVADVVSSDQDDGSHEDGAFSFICTDPHELRVKLPVKGKHKIWKLDKEDHQLAMKGIFVTQ